MNLRFLTQCFFNKIGKLITSKDDVFLNTGIILKLLMVTKIGSSLN